MKSISSFAYISLFIFVVLASGCSSTTLYNPSASGASTSVPALPPNCQTHFKYDHITDKGVFQKVLYREAASNQGDAGITAQFSAQKGGSVSITVGTKISIKVTPPMLAAVLEGTAEINSQVVNTSTASVGNTVTLTLPPHEYGYGNYGINVQVTSGHLYAIDCSKQDVRNATFNVPFSQGVWCIWTSSTPTLKNNDKCPELPE